MAHPRVPRHAPATLARRARAFAATLAIFAAGTLRAQEAADPHQVQPERPTVATHAFTVARGWAEIETGMELDRLHGAGDAFSTPTNIKIGLARRVQLGILGSWVRTSIADHVGAGPSDLTIAVKWRVADSLPVLGAVAILPSVKFPTGTVSAASGTGTTDIGLLLISSHVFGTVSLDANVGYTRRGGDGTTAPRDATLWTISTGFPAIGRLAWVAELFGYPGTSGPAGGAPTVAFLTGPTLQLHRWLALDAGVILPVAGPQARAVYTGGVVNVGKVFGRE